MSVLPDNKGAKTHEVSTLETVVKSADGTQLLKYDHATHEHLEI